MKLKITMAAAVLAIAASFALPGNAAPTAPLAALKNTAAQSTAVEDIAWRRGRCHRGIGGWYKWVKGVGRVQCTVAKNCYTNIFGFRVCDWF